MPIFVFDGKSIGEEKMKKYEELKLEIRSIKLVDTITESPMDNEPETPFLPPDDNMLG